MKKKVENMLKLKKIQLVALVEMEAKERDKTKLKEFRKRHLEVAAQIKILSFLLG